MKIELLADHPEFIPALAQWHQHEWAYLRPGFSIADRVELLRQRSGRDKLPLTFVATEGNDLLGSAMLIEQDMDSRPQYSPWLAGVFVPPEQRCRGIGRALSEHVVQQAAAMGFAALYLYTPSAERFYARFGWHVLEHTYYRNTDVTLMSRTLGSLTRAN